MLRAPQPSRVFAMVSLPSRRVLSWALYDWGNSAFATVVMAGFFPIFFRDFWSSGEASPAITLRLGLANGLASLSIVLLAPVLGSIADVAGVRKRFLAAFAFLGIAATALLPLVREGMWAPAAVLYFLATVGFMGANVFYDALLLPVAGRARLDRVSALGYALGYLGGGLLFALCVIVTLYPQGFGLPDASAAVRLSFWMVAGWWLVFSVPLLLWVTEPPVAQRPQGWGRAVLAGFGQLARTFHEVRRLRHVGLFLLAYWLYIDGVDTIVRMAVDYGRALGFDAQGLIVALLVTQFVGFPAALAFGHLGEHAGARTGIFVALAAYCLITAWAVRLDSVWEFYALAVAVGLVQGGIQALSRSYYARMIPPDRTAEFFGFYNMLGKFAAVAGPVVVGLVGAWSGSARVGIASVGVFFVLGGLLLWRLPDPGAQR